MKTSYLMGSVLQRLHIPLPGSNPIGRSGRTPQGPRPPSGLSLRSASPDLSPRARSPLPQPGPAVATQPPVRGAAPDAVRPRVQADLQKAADEVGWQASRLKIIQDQATRVRNRLDQADKELAGKPPAEGRREIEELVKMLSCRHRLLLETEQSVAQRLQNARIDLAQAQAQAVQHMEEELDALDDTANLVATLRDQASSQHDAAEDDIPHALLNKDAGALARLEAESAKAHAVMTDLQQREDALDQAREALTARLESMQRNLDATRKHLAAAGGGSGETSNARPQPPASPASTSAPLPSGEDLLKVALPHGGKALARLAERAARASPRTLADRLRATFQGRPKPMEGPRQDAFVRLVHADVRAVAEQGRLRLSEAIGLMRTAVTGGQLGASLSQNDRHELLTALNVVEVDQAPLG